MISKRLTRRVEDLESHLLTAVGEPLVVRLNFVVTAGTVVDHRDFHGERAGTTRLTGAPMAAEMVADIVT